MWSSVVFLSSSLLFLIASGKECTKKDFRYTYTECDEDGNRWRVSVPKTDCEGGNILPPVKGPPCDYTCTEGNYLDVQNTQQCQPCQAGTYSLGGGVRFDDWDHLPSGFHTESDSFSRGDDHPLNCSRSQWKPMGSYLAGFSYGCSVELEYSLNLVRSGKLSFEYQSFKQRAVLFQFAVQNEKCQSNEAEQNEFPAETEEGEWKTVNVKLKTGFNIFYWRVWDIMADEKEDITVGAKPAVLIRKIEIQGAAYTSECTKCPSGTYSSGATDSCHLCMPNTFSGKGAQTCTPCNNATEYSESGEKSCKKRPPCQKFDYNEYQTPCDSDMKTRKEYKWIEPQICRTDLDGAAQLPPPGKPEVCPNCNPGMEYIQGKGCVFCPKNQYSDGSKCQSCHVSTIPELQYEYNWWHYMPPNVTSRCLTLMESKCHTHSSWVPSGSYIMTRYGRSEEAFLVLMFEVNGFRNAEAIQTQSEQSPTYGRVIFVFETSCVNVCEFTFVTDDEGENRIVKTWMGTQKKVSYSYSVREQGRAQFSWAFQHSTQKRDSNSDAEIINDYAKIYSIKVTNTVDGGAVKCTTCPKGKKQNECVPCPDGQYIDQNATKCLPCPDGTVVPINNAFGEDSCQPCSEGLRAHKGKVCVSDCKVHDSQGRLYDFTNLNGARSVIGSHLFTASGSQYYHSFNMSLCGNLGMPAVTCLNNLTYSHEHAENMTEGIFNMIKRHKDYGIVKSVICRSTVIPPKGNDKSYVSTMPVSLGDKLIKITTNDTSLLENYKKAGFPTDNIEMDIHFTYTSDVPTRNCESGRRSIISLRCDKKESGNGTIILPPKCPDGTCDGCLFHYLWRTQYACPICRQEDYSVIVGECIGGEQTVHYIPPKHCLMKDKAKVPTKQQKCSVIPFAVQLAIPIIIGVALLLLALLCYCWKRNRKLEYKYSKLIESSSGRDDELPAADSCAFDNDEEERLDRVGFKDGKRGGLLNKFKIGGSAKNNDFETMTLDEKMPLT